MKRIHAFNWYIADLDKKNSCRGIEEFIKSNIKEKQLKSGDLILPYRLMAELNEVSESTVKKAYAKLLTHGWFKSIPGSGTFVSCAAPGLTVPIRESGFKDKFPGELNPLKKVLAKPDRYVVQPYIAVGTDFPNPAFFPEPLFATYYARHSEALAHLSQADIVRYYEGNSLKSAVTNQLNCHRGFGIQADMLEILQERATCLNRVFKVLLKDGDVLVNTSVCDVILSRAMSARKLVVYHISRLGEDFIADIEELLETTPVKAIYIRPSVSFPESHQLPGEAASKLIELAKANRICIIEEEDDHEYWYDSSPPKPLACYDHGGFVIYIAALSKARPNARALRLVVASAEVIQMLNVMQPQSTENRDIIFEHAFADFMEDGHLADYNRIVRKKARDDAYALNLILNNYLGHHLSYSEPKNGLTFWLKFPDHIDLNLVLAELELMGILVPYHPANQKTRKRVGYMLLGFGAFDPNEAEGAAKVLQMVLDSVPYL